MQKSCYVCIKPVQPNFPRKYDSKLQGIGRTAKSSLKKKSCQDIWEKC